MASTMSTGSNRFLILIIGLGLFQVAILGLIVLFGIESMKTDRVLLERSRHMVGDVLPRMDRSLAELSGTAATIGKNVSALRREVSAVDRQVGVIDTKVTGVGKNVRDMSAGLNTYIGDTEGLVWGHSLNPYVLLGLLLVTIATVPVWIWIGTARLREEPAWTASLRMSPEEEATLRRRLDELTESLEKLKLEDAETRRSGSELFHFVEETERFIRETREELGLRNRSEEPGSSADVPDRAGMH